RESVQRAWDAAVESGALPGVPPDQAPPAGEIAPPAKAQHGHLATELPAKTARPLRMAPLAIAQAIADVLSTEASSPGSLIASAAAAAPGVINLLLSDGAHRG